MELRGNRLHHGVSQRFADTHDCELVAPVFLFGEDIDDIEEVVNLFLQTGRE
jgi:hypothetical protein